MSSAAPVLTELTFLDHAVCRWHAANLRPFGIRWAVLLDRPEADEVGLVSCRDRSEPSFLLWRVGERVMMRDMAMTGGPAFDYATIHSAWSMIRYLSCFPPADPDEAALDHAPMAWWPAKR